MLHLEWLWIIDRKLPLWNAHTKYICITITRIQEQKMRCANATPNAFINQLHIIYRRKCAKYTIYYLQMYFKLFFMGFYLDFLFYFDCNIRLLDPDLLLHVSTIFVTCLFIHVSYWHYAYVQCIPTLQRYTYVFVHFNEFLHSQHCTTRTF